MVNSKKMNKSTVAVIVLALLLVLSLVLTATGAWFTDSQNGDGATVNFGHIKLEADSVTVTHALQVERDYVMPDDTMTLTVAYKTDAQTLEAVWVRFKVTAQLTKVGEDAADITLSLGEAAANYDEDGEYIYRKVAVDAKNGVEDKLSVKFTGAEYGNEYQDATITYSVVVEILQSSNIADLDAAKAAFAA